MEYSSSRRREGFNDEQHDYDYQLEGVTGLWIAVLVDIMKTIEHPPSQAEYVTARGIVTHRRECFDMMAEVLGYDPDDLQKRIIKTMKKKGITI